MRYEAERTTRTRSGSNGSTTQQRRQSQTGGSACLPCPANMTGASLKSIV
jgi:hypothetical protein